MKLVSMKMPPRDTSPKCCEVPISPEGPRYPYGLEIELNDDVMTKMGLDSSDFKAGEVVNIVAKAKVTRVSSTDRQKSSGEVEEIQSLSLQITDLGLTNPNSFDNSFDEFSKKKG